MKQYQADKVVYDKMEKQQKLLLDAGYTIAADGTISLFAGGGNALKELALEMLATDPEDRSTALDALSSHAMSIMDNPELRSALQEMRALIATIKVTEKDGGPGKVQQTFDMTSSQRARLDELSERVMTIIENDDHSVWDDAAELLTPKE